MVLSRVARLTRCFVIVRREFRAFKCFHDPVQDMFIHRCVGFKIRYPPLQPPAVFLAVTASHSKFAYGFLGGGHDRLVGGAIFPGFEFSYQVSDSGLAEDGESRNFISEKDDFL